MKEITDKKKLKQTLYAIRRTTSTNPKTYQGEAWHDAD